MVACAGGELTLAHVGIAQGLPEPIGPGAGQGLPQLIRPSPLPGVIGPGTVQVPSLPPNAPSVSSSAITVPAVVAALLSDKLTPEQAWQKGALTVDDLFYFFDQYVSEWGAINGQDQPATRRALAQLLVAHGQAQLKDLSKVSPQVRLWLADYLSSVGDPRTVTFVGSIPSEVKVPGGGEDSLVFQTQERLARYYEDKGELAKGVQVWSRIRAYYGPESRFIPSALIQAARLDMQAGNMKQAQELYAQVAKYGDGWYSGLTLCDQAQQLINQGRHSEARKLLQQPVVGHDADQIHPIILSTLAHSYYQTGDFEQARQYSQEAIAQYKALQNPRPGAGLEAIVPESEERLRWIERWAQAPIIVAPQKLNIVVDQAEIGQIMMRHLAIRTLRDVPLMITAANPLIKAQIGDGQAHDKYDMLAAPPKYYSEQIMTIEIAAGTVAKGLDTIVMVSSPQFPKFEVRVPVHIEAREP